MRRRMSECDIRTLVYSMTLTPMSDIPERNLPELWQHGHTEAIWT